MKTKKKQKREIKGKVKKENNNNMIKKLKFLLYIKLVKILILI